MPDSDASVKSSHCMVVCLRQLGTAARLKLPCTLLHSICVLMLPPGCACGRLATGAACAHEAICAACAAGWQLTCRICRPCT